ncbi:ABC transporter permease [Pandoraea communis]|uniref:Polyamine ABC transporter permease n=1 Tax=Pandoraea communis TaxID=2508297 RepID=A0A5E4V6G9_9BURK|nr:ABC transporter permease [Pandoraea communis]MDM8356154.1 ABC transporter permease [Pandoraea communis]VVE06605.1 polyamine ABC transporter permease [Pandoraea communis]
MNTLASPLRTALRPRLWISPRVVLCAPAFLMLVLFFGMPLYENALRSVGISAIPGTHSAFTWRYYEKLFTDPYFVGIIVETLKMSVWTTFWCLIVGYPVAYFMVRRAGRMAGPLLFVLIMPLLTSIIMRTFGWNVLLGRHGLVNDALLMIGVIERPLRMTQGPAIVYVGNVHVMVSFMVLSIIPVLRSVDQRLEESARVLGAGALRAFLLVTLPLSVEGIITGCLIVFMIINGSFIGALLLGGGTVVTLPLLIFQQFSQTQDMGFASAMGNLLLIVVLICLYVQGRFTGRQKEVRS